MNLSPPGNIAIKGSTSAPANNKLLNFFTDFELSKINTIIMAKAPTHGPRDNGT